MSNMPVEIELKFSADEDCLNRLKSIRNLETGCSGRAVTKTINSFYYDTPNLDLKKSQISLRLRKNGKGWLQTVKSGASRNGGLSSRTELETVVHGNKPDVDSISDLKIRKQVRKILKKQPLDVVFATNIRRTIRNFKSNRGDEIEISFDRGDVTAKNGKIALSELELELKKGSPIALFDLAKEFLENEQWRFSMDSKAGHGYSLLLGQTDSLTELAVEECKHTLDGQDSVESSFSKILRSCYEQIIHNAYVVLENEDMKGPHQLRVGLRKLRSAIRHFRHTIEDESLDAINVQSKGIAGEVGKLRDLDVFTNETVHEAVNHAPNFIGMETLCRIANDRKAQIRNEIREMLNSPKFRDYLLSLGSLIESLKWIGIEKTGIAGSNEKTLTQLARRTLDRNWRRMEKRTKRINSLTVEERHELRKELKKFRYAAEFFVPLFNASNSSQFLKIIRRLQNMFGFLNDIAMIGEIREGLEIPDALKSDCDLAFGFILGFYTEKSELKWNRISDCWNEASKMKKFWNS